jgi:hypothetical protein
MVNEMRGALGHATTPAAGAKAAPLAGERHEAIGTAARASETRKPVREHPTANEAQKLALHEQGGTAFVATLVKLPKEGLQLLAHDTVQHPVLRGAPDVGSTDISRCGVGSELHEL